MDNTTALSRCCHCPRSYRNLTRFCVCEQVQLYPTLRQLPAKLHRVLRYGYRSFGHPFSFAKRNKKPKDERTVRTMASTSGKQRWSAEVRDACVAASAYLSCTNILNDYDGVRHDFTQRKGLCGRMYFCRSCSCRMERPRCAWNAVEETKRPKTTALPVSLFLPAR